MVWDVLHEHHVTLMALDRAREEATCRRKEAFLSEQTALNAAWLISLRWHDRLAVYRCHVCCDWHLTSHGAGLIDPEHDTPPLRPRRTRRRAS